MAHNDAILLVVIPASQAPEVSSARGLRLAKEYDSEGEFENCVSVRSLRNSYRSN